jgi:putative PIN family toxin of toxin-antitoxin system
MSELSRETIITLDTNILLAAFSSRSPYHWLVRGVLEGQFQLALSTEILLEYEEVLTRVFPVFSVNAALNALSDLPNVHKTEPHYRWNMIASDPDDNKFVDCALTAGARFLITNDRHFDILNRQDFPPLTAVTPEEFANLLSTNAQSV